ncbi:MAG TPA: hypothetical protein VFB02_14030 [Bradyrhizobium sp.]|nr:hypothetical protein [Bradyrhizobium sp.]
MTPRLLTDAEAAAYLSLPKAALARVPIGRVSIAGRIRWDRVALDAWLDGLRGVVSVVSPANKSDADAAFDQWAQDAGRAARSA